MSSSNAQDRVRFANLLNEASHAFSEGNYPRCREILATANILARDLHLAAIHQRQQFHQPQGETA